MFLILKVRSLQFLSPLSRTKRRVVKHSTISLLFSFFFFHLLLVGRFLFTSMRPFRHLHFEILFCFIASKVVFGVRTEQSDQKAGPSPSSPSSITMPDSFSTFNFTVSNGTSTKSRSINVLMYRTSAVARRGRLGLRPKPRGGFAQECSWLLRPQSPAGDPSPERGLGRSPNSLSA